MKNLRRLFRMTATVVPILVGLALLVLIIAWLSGTFEEKISPGRQENNETVRKLADEPTDYVQEVMKPYIEEAVGTLKAASRTVVSAKVLATITEVRVSAGDQVEEGDLLIELDRSELDARKKQAEQALASAVAVREEAETNHRRNERLIRDRAVSRDVFDKSEAALRVAQANERRAQQTVREAEVYLSYATIKAPKAGRIVDRLAEPGDTARPGEPLLVLYDATSLRLEAPVVEQLALQLHVGDTLYVYVDAIDQEIQATVDEIVPQADAPSRSFLVKASLPRTEHLFEGMFGRLLIPAGTRRHLCLPTAAIQKVGQLEFVDVAMPDGVIERRFIKTGRLGMPGHIEVLSGLRAGDQVILQEGRSDTGALEHAPGPGPAHGDSTSPLTPTDAATTDESTLTEEVDSP